MNFRKLLLNRCQKEFEKDKDDDVIFEKKQKELEAASEVSYRLVKIELPPLHNIFLFLLNSLHYFSGRGRSSGSLRSYKTLKTKPGGAHWAISSSLVSCSSLKCSQRSSCMTAL